MCIIGGSVWDFKRALVKCKYTVYDKNVIKGFRHKGLESFFKTGSKAGIQPQHASRLRMQLAQLSEASKPEDMRMPNWRLHPLKGSLQGNWAVWVDKNWRLTFIFQGGHAASVDYQDYH